MNQDQKLTKTECLERQSYLQNALTWVRGSEGYLNAAQKIAVNQERGALYQCIRDIERTKQIREAPRYKVPLKIEIQLKAIHKEFNTK